MASKIERLRQAVLQLYNQHKAEGTLPTNGRFLFYELETLGIISKVQTGARRPDQDVSVALTDLRESGQIPWEDIIDETRTVEDYTGSKSVKQWLLDVLGRARIDPWKGEPPTIVCESRSLMGALRPIARLYRAQITSTNGQCAGFLHTEVAPLLRPGKCGKPRKVLYFGDLDFSGGHIEANNKSVLEQEVGPLDWERLALTEAQAKRYNLTPIQKFDKRDKKYHEAIETEALSQQVIVNILRERLESMLPEPLERVLEREKRQRRQIIRLLSKK